MPLTYSNLKLTELSGKNDVNTRHFIIGYQIISQLSILIGQFLLVKITFYELVNRFSNRKFCGNVRYSSRIASNIYWGGKSDNMLIYIKLNIRSPECFSSNLWVGGLMDWWMVLARWDTRS